MESRPIIVSFGGLNAAISPSPHQMYHRLIIDKLKTDNARAEPI